MAARWHSTYCERCGSAFANMRVTGKHNEAPATNGQEVEPAAAGVSQ
jgi:hypothetical protein